MKKERTIKIEIKDISIDDEGGFGYYAVHYDYWINGDKKSDVYHSDYEGWNKGDFKAELQDGLALDQVLMQITETLI